jgi:MFS family permease
VTRLANGARVGKKLAFHTFGGFVGTTVSFVVVAFLGVRFGWRNALIILSIPGFVLAYLFWLLFDIPKQQQEKKPEAAPAAKKAVTSGIVALVGVTTVQGMFSRGLSAFLPVFLVAAYGMSVQQAALYATLMTGTGCLGLLGGGVIADKFPRPRVLMVASLMLCATSLVLAQSTLTPLLLALVLMLSGLAQHGSGPSQTALVSEIGPKGSQGSLFGLTFAGSFLGGSLVTIIAGWMAVALGVRSIFVFLAALALTRAAMTIPLARIVSRTKEQGVEVSG